MDIAGAVGKTTTSGRPLTGTGSGITGSSADGGLLVRYAVVHGNDAGGILNSEFYDNTQNPAFLGWNASAVKGKTEFEAAYNYVHNEQGNGLWCDVGCKDDPAREDKGFWVHDNLTVDNGRSGIRYESSPNGLATGVHASEPLIDLALTAFYLPASLLLLPSPPSSQALTDPYAVPDDSLTPL